MDAFSKYSEKDFSNFCLCLCSNDETKKYLEKLNTKNVHFKGNIKLIDKVNESKIDDLNEDFLLKKDFGLLLVRIKKKILFA